MTCARVCPSCELRLDDVLRELRVPGGVSAAEWLWSPAAGADGHVLLGRGSVVVHPGAGVGDVGVQARVTALPLASRSVAALVVPSVLPDLPDVDGMFAEVRRVLRPHGLLTLLVPAGPSFGVRGRRLRAEVRAWWTHRSAVDHPDWLVTAADFAVLGDDRVRFRDDRVRFRVPSAVGDAGAGEAGAGGEGSGDGGSGDEGSGDEGSGDAGALVDRLCAAGLLPAGLPAGLRRRIAAHPGLRSGRITLRRIVARR